MSYNSSDSDDETIRSESSHVGLSSLPQQAEDQAFRSGASYTIMLVGESGLGKTSFINTLFNAPLLASSTVSPALVSNSTTAITKHTADLVEDGFHLQFTAIDTPGFGDLLNNRHSWYLLASYLDAQHRRRVYQELQPDRSRLSHDEVHACVYFIRPSGTGLTQLDISAMRHLSTRVNLVPVISKADCYTADELAKFKATVSSTLKAHHIESCLFIESASDAQKLVDEMPFALVNAGGKYENASGQLVRGRKYDWGVVDCENPDHCDFVKLREFLVESHMRDLIVSTQTYYEHYRSGFLQYWLATAIDRTFNKEEMVEYGVARHTASSQTSARQIKLLLETHSATAVLKVMERLDIGCLEGELSELEPSFQDRKAQIKAGFTAYVQEQAKQFKKWKCDLWSKSKVYNKEIEDLRRRQAELQSEILQLQSSDSL